MSLYENKSPSRQNRDQGMCFGRITKVFPEDRLCEVKTFMGQGLQDDNSIPKCQWINMDSHPDGDESTTIPRANSFGIVFFIGGTPFIFGFFSPLTGTGSASLQTNEKEELNEGDRILKTIAGNKVILRAHGEVEIHSTDTCRTIYFPDKHLLNTLCRNYEFRTDGGTIDWVNNGDDTTTAVTEYRDDIKRTNVIIEERGTVDGKIISRTSIGAGTDDGITEPVWTRTILSTGETELFIRAPGADTGHKVTTTPDGGTKVEIAGKFTSEIKATGETTIDIGPGKFTLTISPEGELSIANEGTTKLHSKGNVELTTDGELKVTAEGAGTIQIGGDMKVTATGKATITAKNIDLDGGGNLEQLLTTPSAISDFTGAPIQRGSSSIKATN